MIDVIDEAPPEGSPDSLKRVVMLATLMTKKQSEVKEAEQILKDEKEALRILEREDLPQLMAELGLSEIKLEDGSVVAVKEEVDTHISEEHRPLAHGWLIEHGFGGLIKTEVTVAFGRGEREAAVKCAEAISKEHEGVQVKEVVHASTLKAFVKEQLAEGASVPFDLFGVFPYSIAKVQPKSSTRKGKQS